MTWPDFVTIGLCIALGILESRRGFVPAFFAMIGMILTVEIAGASYTRLVSPSISYLAAYVIAITIGTVVVAISTTLIQRYAPTDIGSFDNSLGGLIGIFTGLVIAHALYGAVILGYGSKAAEVYAHSALAGQIYELRSVHSFLDFMSRIGTTSLAEPSGSSR